MKCRILILLIILLYIIQLINSSEIIIPFISELSHISKNLTPYEFISSLSSNELYTKIKIGTPWQNLNFLLDFNFYNSYVIKDEVTGKNYERFLYNLSTTFNPLGQSLYFSYSYFISAINSSDIINFNNDIKNYNLTFLHAYKFRNDYINKIKYPGALGFNVVPFSEPFHFESGFIYQLKKKNITNNYMFTLKFNDNDYNGKIIIEKNIYENYPLDNFKSDYCLMTEDYGFYWGWNHVTVKLNKEQLSVNNVYIKPELGLIILNTYYKDIFNKKFFEEKIKEGKCYNYYLKYNFFYCDKDVKIDIGELYFEIKRIGLKFTLNSEDLFLEYNNKNYFLIVFGVDTIKTEIKLGYPFVKKYDLIFDIEKRHIGFYDFKIKYDENSNNNVINTDDNNEIINDNNNDIKNKENNNNKAKNIENNNNINYAEKILLGILIIIFIVLFLMVIFITFRHCERKRKGKLFSELFL